MRISKHERGMWGLNVAGLILLLATLAGCTDSPGDDWKAGVNLAPVVAPEAAAFLIEAQEAHEAANPQLALALTDSAERRAGSGNLRFLADVNFLRARIQTDVNRDDLAASAYERVLELEPGYRGAWLNLGNIAFRQGEFTKALSAYRKEQAAYPTADLHVLVGRAYAELGKVDSAQTAYEQALAMDGASAAAHIRMAELLEKNGEPAAALSHAQKALTMDGKNANYRYFTGTLLLRTNQYSEAVQAFTEVLKQQPDRQGAHYNLGQALTRLGETKRAQFHLSVADSLFKVEHELKQWETKTVIDPENPAVWATYGYALRRFGRIEAALRAYGVALHLDPDHADVRYEMANLYMLKNQPDRALEQYGAILQMDSTYVGAWINVGIAYARAGQPAAAQRAWQTALRHEPGHPLATQYLTELLSH